MIDTLRSKNLLHLQDVFKSYGSKLVLDDIDLSVAPGEFCTVVGPSGCGKSTLLRLILGQEAPDAGQVLVRNQAVGLPDATRGIVYQRYSLFPHLTVLDNVLLGKELGGNLLERAALRRAHREEAVAMLERVRLAEHADKYPHELSGGMQQRVAIVQTLIMRPQIVLMDEPFGALDPGVREDLQVFLLELWEEFDLTVFFVTHDLEEGVYLGTRLLVLSQYYTDDRGDGPGVARGAKIVADHPLPKEAQSTQAKSAQRFADLITSIRQDAFDPAYRQHVTQFNLRHPDSFRTP
jgi:NitT/TauT family transport system ATP-binding protein